MRVKISLKLRCSGPPISSIVLVVSGMLSDHAIQAVRSPTQIGCSRTLPSPGIGTKKGKTLNNPSRYELKHSLGVTCDAEIGMEPFFDAFSDALAFN